MSDGNHIFEGRTCEDPQEYIDEVELFAVKRISTDKDSDEKRINSVCGKHLRVDARDWYLDLKVEDGRNWEKMQANLSSVSL